MNKKDFLLLLKDGEQKVHFKAAGEWCYLWTPPTFRLNGNSPIVIHHHGAGGYVKKKRADWLDTESKAGLIRAVMDGCGCSVAGSHACGNHWGNGCAVNADTGLLEALEECPGLAMNRLGLMGGGLGGMLVWNSVLGPFKGRVSLVAVLQAVASLEAIIREQRFKAVCLKAFGLSKNIHDDEAVVQILPHDPLTKLKALNKGTKLPVTAIYHGAKDTWIPAETHAISLAEALKMVGGKVELNLFNEVEHSLYNMGKQMEERLKRFFSAL